MKPKFKKQWSEMTHYEKCVAAGFFEEAKTDEHWDVRLIYYQTNGFDESAKTDEDEDIRELAATYFDLLEQPEDTIELNGKKYKLIKE